MSLDILLRYANINIIKYDGHEFRTPRHLLDMGIAMCSDCSSILPHYPGDNFCPTCGTTALVIADDIPMREYIPPTPLKPGKRREPLAHLLEKCKHCHSHLMFRVPGKKKCCEKHSYFRERNGITKINEMQMFESAKEEIKYQTI